MTATISPMKLLDQMFNSATSTTDQGTQFERFVLSFLQTGPVWAAHPGRSRGNVFGVHVGRTRAFRLHADYEDAELYPLEVVGGEQPPMGDEESY